MNSSQVKPEADLPTIYVDPEAPDMSEQEFAASLLSTAEAPRFVLDTLEEQGSATAFQEVPRAVQTPTDPATDEGAADQSIDPEPVPDWREQVSAKVNSYKTRSRHKPRYPSLQLQFDPPPYRASLESTGEAMTALTFSQSVAAEIVALQPSVVAEPEPPRISLEATARVLEFPRSAPPAFDPHQLAEPILSQPRIVEAPELLPPPPAMGGILMEPSAQPEPERQVGLDFPLQTASLSRRLWAGGIDALLLAIALATFGYIFFRMTAALPPFRTVSEFAVGLMAVLWPAYEYAFLVFSESTPGLRLAKLQIQRFDGSPASRSLRRWRALASFLSAASIGLGYLWCFLDEDQLTWHDRITRTHLAPES